MDIEALFKRAGEVATTLENGVREGERVIRAAAPLIDRAKGLARDVEQIFKSSFSADLREAAAVLGLTLPTDFDAIEAARKKAVLSAHPDRGGTGDQLKRVTTAAELLKRNFPRFP